MKPVTYSLSLNEPTSQEYYKDVRVFTDEVILKAESSISPIINEYSNYILKYNLETLREKEEYLLELLSFGVLWRTYANTALAVRYAPFITLAKMGEWRKKHQKIKPLIDLARGGLISLMLLPEKKETIGLTKPTIEKIDHICKWFEATGEFREQSLRFVRWRAYWGTLPGNKLEEIFSAIETFRLWFEKHSLESLGKYTSEVDSFTQNSKDRYRWREDRISCSRSRLEYHLNMVGAELMNRAFRKDYTDTEITAVLLPGCMRSRPANECRAIKEEKGLKCIGCESECRVNKIRVIGKNKNYETYVIPHASNLALWSSENGGQKRGVVASACVTTLVEGGWELKRYGVPAQCVLLDYSGCKKHWHPEGIVTSLNKHELERIVSKNNN